MAYEPLTPYKSKDDPLWYVFDENQNFKTFDTRDKAMNHIKAIKYPQNEGIEFNTSNTENQKIEPIKPQKIEFATDESNKEKKEEISWKQFGINEANAIKTAPQQLGLGLFDTAEGFINAGEYWVTSTQFLEGYYDEPKEGWSDDHKKAIDVFNKEIMAKGKINDPEYIKKVFQDNGLTRSRMYGGRVVTELPAEKQREFIEKNTTIQMLRTARKNLKDIPAYDRWEDAVGDPTYLGTVLRSAPNLIAQISLARMHPTLGMAYAGGLMSGDSFQLAQPYVENGTLTPQEAVDIASQVGAFSVLWNAGPSYIWGATKPQKKIVEKMLFDKVLKKKLYKKKSLEFFTKGSIEMFQEVGDEINTMYGESKYRDLDYDEIIPRVKMSAFAGYVLGGTMGGVFAHYNNKEVPKLIDRLVEQENMMLPMNMSIDKDGYISFKVNEDDFNNKENYEFVKNIVNDKKFKKRFDPEELRKKYPDVPLNLAIFNELNTQNPNTDDVDIEYNKKLITSIMTDEDIRKANYDPDNPQWLTAELQEGEEGYEEGKRKFKVHTLGSNIYNSSGGSIVLSEGVSQDVFVEELTEVLYKKLATTNPKLKRRIDRWIKKTTKILDDNNIGGPRNIELFSKFYTFNYLGYADTEFDLGQIAKMPKGILKDFDAIMGEQKDGTNLSFLFKGKSKGEVITETETDVDETSQTVETPEESFRLTPQQEKFFKDSKAREPSGELTQVYHGTSSEDFEVFDPSAESGPWKVLGQGVYFSRLPQQANSYTVYDYFNENKKQYKKGNPRIIPAYLNLKNPFIIEGQGLRREIDTPTKPTAEMKKRFREEQIKANGSDYGYWYDNWLYLKNDVKTKLLMEFGYDGIMDGNVYVAFKPEQIKSQFNPKPTSDPRMSFRLSPQKLSKIEDFLMEVTMEGKPSRFWYEKSGQALLDIVDENYDKARKLLSIIAITSPQMDVKSNFGQMVKANYKYVQGMEPEAGRFPKAMAKRIKDVMEGKDFGGIKTNSFLDNLLVQLEEYERSTDEKPVTVDLWMMRAFGFDKDVPTDLEYKQVRTAVQKIAKKLGWEPHQVQASIWTSVQARWNLIYAQEKTKAIKSGVLKKVGRKYVWRSKQSEQNFRKKLFKLLKTTSMPQKAIEDNNYDYSDALNSFKGIISTETFPHPSTGVFEGLNPSFEQQLDYDYDIRQLLTDENGKDKIAKLIGLLEVGKFNAPGFYEGDISPSQQLEVLMSTTETSINSETKSLLELYASIYGILTKQQAVGVTKVFQPKSQKQANVVMVKTKNDVFFEQIYSELFNKGYDTGAIPQNYGFMIVNFDPKVDNKKFYNDVKEILNNIYDNSSESLILERGQSDGLYIDNNWKENVNGENYRKRISESKQRDAIEQFISSTSNEISKINENYKQKWSEDKSYRLAPKDPDELTPEVIDELDRAEKLPQIYSQPPRESKFSISKKFNIDYKAGRSLEKVLKPISSALEKIHPKLKRALRDFEYRLLTKTRERRIIVKNFYDKAKAMSQEDYYHLDLAFKNADGDKINELIKKYKLKKEYKALRKMLDDIGQEYVDAGGELGYIENYIPRQVKDLDGLRQNIFGLDPKLQTLYKKLEKQAIKEKGKELDLTEKEHIINMIMRGYKTLNEGKPGSAKPRVIKLVDNDMNEYYAHSSEAMMNHIEQMTDVIEKRNFLGKNELTEDGIAKYIREVNEETPLTQDQEMAIKEILNARINPAVTSKITGAIKNSTYILTMGNPLSAITQLGDLVWAYDQAGVFQTIKTIFSKKKIKIEDLGIEKIGQEFTSSTPLAGAVDRIFKIVRIAQIDKLGKETLINSVFNRYVKEAKKGKPSKQLSNDIDKYFDSKDSKKIKKLMNDLKQGKVTEDVQILVFNKLLDHQPVTQSEMPQVYLQSGLSRLSYQLKTFTIRQLDVIRGKIVNDIVKAKTYKEKALGLGKFVRFLALWVFAGATKDIIKDLILNRPVDAEDYVYENLLQFIGASRYQIYQAKRYGLRGIISRFVSPPSYSIYEDLVEDVAKVSTDKKLTKKQEKMTAEEIEELRGDEVREDACNSKSSTGW